MCLSVVRSGCERRCPWSRQVLDVVLSRLLQAEPRPAAAAGLRLLQRAVCAAPPAPLLLSLLLSFISALFVFLSCAYSQLAGNYYKLIIIKICTSTERTEDGLNSTQKLQFSKSL